MGNEKRRSLQGRKPNRSRRGNIALVDLETGEVLDGTPVLFPMRYSYGVPFMVLFQQALGQLARDRTAGLEQWRVLAFLLERSDFGNWVKLSQTEAGAELGMKRQSVNRALKGLLARGLIEQAEASINGHRVYRVSKALGWKGTGKAWKEAGKADKAPSHLRLVPSAKPEAG